MFSCAVRVLLFCHKCNILIISHFADLIISYNASVIRSLTFILSVKTFVPWIFNIFHHFFYYFSHYGVYKQSFRSVSTTRTGPMQQDTSEITKTYNVYTFKEILQQNYLKKKLPHTSRVSTLSGDRQYRNVATIQTA